MKPDMKQDLKVLYQVCVFRTDRKKRVKKMAVPASNWLTGTFSTFSLKPPNGIFRNLAGNKNWTSSTKFVFSGRSEKLNCRPGLWLDDTFSTFSLQPLDEIFRNLESKNSINILYQNLWVFSGRWEKKMATQTSDWQDGFDYSSGFVEWSLI